LNTRKLCSALGVGLAFVAVLSLISMSGFAAAGSTSHQKEVSGSLWHARAKVTGTWADSDPYVFTSSKAWHETSGFSVTSEYFNDGKVSTVYAMVEGKAWTGTYGHAHVWASPAGYPNQLGGDAYTW
jgi:hypothetical protein